jgi:hypothetical protein
MADSRLILDGLEERDRWEACMASAAELIAGAMSGGLVEVSKDLSTFSSNVSFAVARLADELFEQYRRRLP